MTNNKLSEEELKEKFQEYKELMNWFYEKGILKENNLVGAYGEYWVAKRLGLELKTSSTKNIDATDKSDRTYQIKSRRLSGFDKNGEEEFGGVSLEENDKFDYLILLLFEPDFKIKSAYKIPFESVAKHATYKKGKYIVRLNDTRMRKLNNDDSVENILIGSENEDI